MKIVAITNFPHIFIYNVKSYKIICFQQTERQDFASID